MDVVSRTALPSLPDRECITPTPAPAPPTVVLSRKAINGLLSTTELRVLDWLLKGLSEKEAAASLHVSWHTVHSHAKRIYRLLGVHSRAELMSHFVSPPPKAEGAP